MSKVDFLAWAMMGWMAIDQCRAPGGTDYNGAVNALAGLMHWCDQQGEDFSKIAEEAHRLFCDNCMFALQQDGKIFQGDDGKWRDVIHMDDHLRQRGAKPS